MRLVQKLSLALILTTSTIVAIGGAIRAQREVAVLEFDRVRDHRLMGRAVGAAIAAVWHSDGEARALATLEQANVADGRVRMRWVWHEGGPPDMHTAFDAAMVLATPMGETITRAVANAGTDGMRYTYVPLAVDRHRRGALELSESLSGQRRFAQRVVLETIVTTIALALASAGLSTLLGIWIVGRPMEALTGKARRVGQGDFTGPLHLLQKDELGELAHEMNTMCDRLVLAHERVGEETAKKIAAQDQLRHADRLTTVGKLASGIAHELGTPLNVVSGRAEMIASGETTPAETLDYAKVIIEASEKMTRIIGQLLEFARARGRTRAGATGASTAEARTACALQPLVKKALLLLGPLASKRDVELVLDGEVGNDLQAIADATAIEQVLTNLIVNGVQSMTRPGRVRVDVSRHEATPPTFVGGATALYAVLTVKDEGQGIHADDVAHVFEPFFTTKDVGDGTGLGLSVAYGIVQEHGGWIDVDSVVGVGSTFRVYLPIP